ncbi:MAG: VOC family protein [Pseudomonadota bacterium]
MIILDHVVIGASDLDAAIAGFSTNYGLTASKGGAHPDLGTHNALIGAGQTYIELLAPLPGTQCAFEGLNTVKAPTLFHYALRTRELEAIKERAAALGVNSDGIQTGRRQTADGALLTWRILHFRGHALGAALPFFIDWQNTLPPANQLDAQVSDLALTVTAPPMLSTLLDGAVRGLEIEPGDNALSLSFTVDDQRAKISAPHPLPAGL